MNQWNIIINRLFISTLNKEYRNFKFILYIENNKLESPVYWKYNNGTLIDYIFTFNKKLLENNKLKLVILNVDILSSKVIGSSIINIDKNSKKIIDIFFYNKYVGKIDITISNNNPKSIHKIDKNNDIHIVTDNFTYDDYSKLKNFSWAVTNIINNKTIELPLTIGIYGPDGTGKSHFMKLLEKNLSDNLDNIIIKFNPWVFEGSNILWAGLITTMYDKIEVIYGKYYIRWFRFNKNLFDSKENIICFLLQIFVFVSFLIIIPSIWKYVNLIVNIIIILISSTIGFSLFNTIFSFIKIFTTSLADEIINISKKPNWNNQLGFMHEIKEELVEIITPILKKTNKKLIILVDDIDKCKISKILEAINALQLMLENEPPFQVIITMDLVTVTESIEIVYKKEYKKQNIIDGKVYIDRLVNIPIYLPLVNIVSQINYVEEMLENKKLANITCKTIKKFKKYIKNEENINKYNLCKDDEKNIKNIYCYLKGINYTKHIDNQEMCLFINNYISKSKEIEIKIANESKNGIQMSKLNLFPNKKLYNKIIKIRNDINISNLDLEQLKNYYNNLNRLLKDEELDKETMMLIRNIIIKLQYIYNNKKNEISNKIFFGLDKEETDEFIKLIRIFGSELNLRKMKIAINIYNFTKYLLPKSIIKQKTKIIQIIFMNELWNFRTVCISLCLSKKKKIENNYNDFIMKINPLKLIDYYNGNVVAHINNNLEKHSKWLKYDNLENDFIRLLKLINMDCIDFYLLHKYSNNLNTCLLARLNKI